MAKKESNKTKLNVESLLKKYSKMNIEQLYSEFDSRESGLNLVEADEKLEEVGKNVIDVQNSNSLLTRLKEAIINPFNIVLLVVAIITFITDVVISTEPSYATVIMLILIVILSAIISFVQTEKSNSAAKKLQNMISNKVDVIRNGVSVEVDIANVVPGDIVKLASRRYDTRRC